MNAPWCIVPDCHRLRYCRGLCKRHYMKAARWIHRNHKAAARRGAWRKLEKQRLALAPAAPGRKRHTRDDLVKALS